MGKGKRPRGKGAPVPAAPESAPAAPAAPAATGTRPVGEDARLGWWLAGVTLVALVIRAIRLGYCDLWVDENLFLNLSLPPSSPWEVMAAHYRQFPSIGHLPLGAMLQNAFLHLFGGGAGPDELRYAAGLQRVPALVWGTLSVPVLMLAARRVASRPVALVAGLLYAGFFFPVFYSREAYYYAPLMLESCLALLGLTGVMTAERRRGGWIALWLVALTAATLTHITGVLLCLGHGVGLAFAGVAGRRDNDAARVRTARWRTLAPLVLISALPLVPFLLIRMANPGQQGVSGAPGWWVILYDMLAKQFFGVHPVSGAVAILLVVAGAVSLVRSGPAARGVAIAFATVAVAILLGSLTTQYSSRYFTAASPGVTLMLAAGVVAFAKAAMRGDARRTLWVSVGTAVMLVVLQVVLFHLPAYRLEAKARNYGGMARWLNENLEPGTPYLLESAYDQRWLGHYHQTPDLTPGAPYTHGPGPEEMERLRAIQQQFLLQFPEAPFVEAARHGTEFNAQVPVWTWPHAYFRQRADIRNRALEHLVSIGIWPQIHAAGMPDIEYHTVIWYNEEADWLAAAAERGEPAMAVYAPPWAVRPVAQRGRQIDYLRVHPPGTAMADLVNLTGQALTGRLVLEAGVAASASVPMEVRFNDEVLGRETYAPNGLRISSTPGLTLPPGRHRLRLATPPGMDGRIQAILVRQIRFEPSPPETATP